jgi:hypothetical protein
MQATFVLHNYIRQESTQASITANGEEHIQANDLVQLGAATATKSREALQARNSFMENFMFDGRVEWQQSMVNRVAY